MVFKNLSMFVCRLIMFKQGSLWKYLFNETVKTYSYQISNYLKAYCVCASDDTRDDECEVLTTRLHCLLSGGEAAEFIQTEAVEKFHQLVPHNVNIEFDNTNVTLSMHSQKKWVSFSHHPYLRLFFVMSSGCNNGPVFYLCRHLNWTLKSLKVAYRHDDEHLPLRSFTPELIFPHSSLNLILEGSSTVACRVHGARRRCHKHSRITHNFVVADGLLLSQSRQRILCVNALRTTLQVSDGLTMVQPSRAETFAMTHSHSFHVQVTSTEISGSFTVNTCIVHYRHQEFLPWLDLFPWEQLIHRKATQRKRQVSKWTARKSALSLNFPLLQE